jgi:lambda repressor-like predicted transcriptional regulator
MNLDVVLRHEGRSLAWLADATGVSYNTLRHVAHHNQRCSKKVAARIASVLDCEVRLTREGKFEFMIEGIEMEDE